MSSAATSPARPSGAEPQLDRRAAIIRGAAAVVGRVGYAGTSVKEIAAEAGVAPGLVHYYFASKEELIVTVAAALCDETTEHWLRAGAGITDPIERIDAAITYVDDLRTVHPEFYRLVFDLYVAGFANPNIRTRMRELWDRYVGIVHAEVESLFTSLGVACPTDTRALASGIAAAMDGIALMALANGHDAGPDYRALRTMLVSVVVTAFVSAGRPVPMERLRPLLGAAETA